MPDRGAAAHTVPLTVPEGTSIQIALDQEVRVRKMGEPITGRVMQPVYAFDQVVIPAGSPVNGEISGLGAVPGRIRLLDALNENFTPARKVSVNFSEVLLPSGKHLAIHADTNPASGQVVRLASAGEHEKGGVRGAAAKKMDQVRAQWDAAMQQVSAPGKNGRLVRYAVAQLPAHPQYLDAGTLYSVDLTRPLEFGAEPSPEAAFGAPPPGSLAHAVLLTSLDSATTVKGSDVEAELAEPLFDQKHLVLPAGTRLRGTVLQASPALRWHRAGTLRISFRQIVLPEGAVQQVDTRLEGIQSDAADHTQLDSEGGTKTTSSKTRYLSTGATLGLALVGSGGRDDVGDAGPIAGGATGFKLIGLVVGVASRSHAYGILMSAYGGCRSIYTNFVGKGRDLSFPKDTRMEIGFGSRSSAPAQGATAGLVP